MKIASIKLKNFKRFTDLTIDNIPESAKLVMIVGPNGCGKTSVFEAINIWKSYIKANLNFTDKSYVYKDQSFPNTLRNDILIKFHSEIAGNVPNIYLRGAYRNEADFKVSSISKQSDPTARKQIRLIDQDSCVSSNYQRLISQTLAGVFNGDNDKKTVKDLRDEIIGSVNSSLRNVFDDLILSSIGDPVQNGSFYFTKGSVKDFHYKNLSAGEKSAFDLILDIVIKSEYFKASIYCIDEPELHIHTSLQSRVLEEMYNMLPDQSQMWIATHSIGMLKKAKELEAANPGSVVFINFADIDFDTQVILTPSKIDTTIWKKFLDLAFGELAGLVAPSQIVFCEGDPSGTRNKKFDATIYTKIFSDEFSDTTFVSVGSCSEIENPDNISFKIIRQLLDSSSVIKLVDRDSKSPQEIQECNDSGITVLRRRHLEAYLFDDEVIAKICNINNADDKYQDCINAKQESLERSIARGNATDDIKSAAGDTYTAIKRILSLTQCGNTLPSFLRDTIAPLITPDLNIYTELRKDIFNI